jgi:hypothetical protein
MDCGDFALDGQHEVAPQTGNKDMSFSRTVSSYGADRLLVQRLIVNMKAQVAGIGVRACLIRAGQRDARLLVSEVYEQAARHRFQSSLPAAVTITRSDLRHTARNQPARSPVKSRIEHSRIRARGEIGDLCLNPVEAIAGGLVAPRGNFG